MPPVEPPSRKTPMKRLKIDRVLVTGGAGYIGSHACKLLASHGVEPIVYDDLSTGHREFVKWGPLIEGDILDTEKLTTSIRTYSIDHVIHFAAQSLVSESVTRPHIFYSVNVSGTLSLLSAMLCSGCKSLVVSSTGAIYGIANASPVVESEPAAAVNPYGHSKSIVESMLENYRQAHGMSVTALRYFNASGADPDCEIGERHTPETHLIPRAIDAAYCATTLDIFGTDFPTPDGTAIRDYIHVNDLAVAHISALERHAGGSLGSVFNLGAGRGYSVRQVLAAVSSEIGKPILTREVSRRVGDPPELVADVTRARQQLGFDPCYSDISTIIATAAAWHQKDRRVVSG